MKDSKGLLGILGSRKEGKGLVGARGGLKVVEGGCSAVSKLPPNPASRREIVRCTTRFPLRPRK